MLIFTKYGHKILGMNQKYTGLLLGLFICSVSFAETANFSGCWKGTGKLIRHSNFTGNEESPCSLIDISIAQTPTEYKTERYHAICGMMDSDWGPDIMEIKDGSKLIQWGDEVGSINENILKSSVPDGGVVYAFNLRLNNAGSAAPTLDTYYGTQSMIGAMVIEGKLQPYSCK